MHPQQPEQRLWTPQRWRGIALDTAGDGETAPRDGDVGAAIQTQEQESRAIERPPAPGGSAPARPFGPATRHASPGRLLIVFVPLAALVVLAVLLLALRAGGVALPGSLLHQSAAPKMPQLSPSLAAADAQTPTYDALFPAAMWPSWLAVLVWLLVVELLGLAAFPLTFLVLPGLRDRGLGLSKLLGLLLLGYLVWLPASLRVLPFDRWVVALALLALVAAGAAVGWWRRAALWTLLRVRWRLLIAGEVVFFCAFAYLAWIRALDPNLFNLPYSGEKPFELAMLNGILRSRAFPPLDPWFAGGYLNYYYYGQYLVAVLVRLTGIAPATALNLALAMFFAMTFCGAFSIVASVTRRVWVGVVGGVAAVLLGNVQSGMQLLRQVQALAVGQPVPAFNYVAPSRVIPYTINEFPYWSYLYGDLHAHVIDLSIEMLVIALAVSLLLSARRWGAAAWRAVLPTLGALALALGSMWSTNTWDIPTYTALAVLALALRPLPLGAGTSWRTIARRAFQWRAVVGYVAAVGATVAAAYVLFWPFHQTYFDNSMGIWTGQYFTLPRDFVILFGVWLFVAVTFFAVDLHEHLTARLVRRLASHGGLAPWLGAWMVVLVLALVGVTLALPRGLTFGLALLLLLGVVLAVRARQSRMKLITYLLLLWGLAIPLGVELVFIRTGPTTTASERLNTVFKFYEQAALFLALGATLAGVDLARRLRLLPRRMVAGLRTSRAQPTPSLPEQAVAARGSWRVTTWSLRIGWLVAMCLLLGGALAFPVEGTRSRVEDPALWAAIQPPPAGIQPSGLSLDGMAYMQGWYPDDYAAITWIQGHITGMPTIVEAVTDQAYTWQGRVAVYTGLPDVTNWGHHEKVQRTAADVIARQQGVAGFYGTTSAQAALAFLHTYDVRYVYLGALERTCYYSDHRGRCSAMSTGALAKFTQLEQMGALRAVYRNPGVVIYAFVG